MTVMSTPSEPYLGSPDNPRTPALVGYITWIGWLLAYFALYRYGRNPFAGFHMRQSLMIHGCATICYILAAFGYGFRLSLWLALAPAAVVSILWLIGVLDAVNGR